MTQKIIDDELLQAKTLPLSGWLLHLQGEIQQVWYNIILFNLPFIHGQEYNGHDISFIEVLLVDIKILLLFLMINSFFAVRDLQTVRNMKKIVLAVSN